MRTLTRHRVAAPLAIAGALAMASAPVFAQDASAPADPFGPAEKADLTIAIPFPDIVMYGRYYIADAEGYFADEGITVEVVTADDTVAAVVSGSADIGVQSAGAAILAANEGLPVRVIGSHSCRQSFNFAVQPEVTSAADLAGKDIVLAGTPGDPAQFEREKVLNEAGWDVMAQGVNLVYPGPGSDSWRQFFLEDRIALMPFYEDDRPALVEDGASFPISEVRAWPNDSYVASTDWLAQNPNSAGRFLRAVMRATQFLEAPGLGELPANKDRVLEIYAAQDVDTSAQAGNPGVYSLQAYNYCPNLYYGQEGFDSTIANQQLDVSASFDDVADLTALEAAQASLGLTNDPPADIPWPDPMAG
jgi:NitT/TauT family transport system substrate-binding protein